MLSYQDAALDSTLSSCLSRTHAGKNERGYRCRGGGNVTNYDGSLPTEIWDKEGIIYADVNPAAVPASRQNNPWYTDRRPDLYRKYM